MNRKKYCIANWKMYKSSADAEAFTQELLNQDLSAGKAKLIICPPYTLLNMMNGVLADSGVGLGAENMHFADEGAFTGEISADMLLDQKCEWVILGHSERRHVFAETDELIHQKFIQAQKKGLKPILCIGETITEREANQTREILYRQLASALADINPDTVEDMIVAYEPVWAIGTGRTATPDMAVEAHQDVRSILTELGLNADEIPILYGGSVKPANAKELIDSPGVDGFLIGGASLIADSFYQIFKTFK